ncbi:MAG TPA: endonuclease/exonuclease/phosphatase family protein [Isosphaeraceae bacterium]|jgi:endonuclease/exonuclease/phosphatase (EEP) superfamily protein YafD
MTTDSGEPASVLPASGRRAWLRRAGRLVPTLLGIAAVVHPLATLAARWSWRADLLTHFQEPALAVSLLAAGLLAWRRRWAAAGLAVLALFQAGEVYRYAGTNPVAPDPRDPTRLRILMSNVLDDNVGYDLLEAVIRAERPDVVGLVEVSDAWIAGLANVRREFPYRYEFPAGARGLALWFRRPPRSVDPPRIPLPGGNPVLHATLDFAGRRRHLWLVHPPNPLSRRGRSRGRAELAALAGVIGGAGGSAVVVGDLNRTDGSPLFADFLRATGLRDSRLGFGRQPSWPAGGPYRIAIDHAFVTPDLAVVSRHLGPDIGSDHLPLILDIAPASPTNAATQSAQSGP